MFLVVGERRSSAMMSRRCRGNSVMATPTSLEVLGMAPKVRKRGGTKMARNRLCSSRAWTTAGESFRNNVQAFVLAFLPGRRGRIPDWARALRRVDWLGNAVFIPAIAAVLFGLTFGGVQYPWASWRIILPLVLGFAGWAVFHVLQACPRLCPEPSIPPRILGNRTSAAGYLLTAITAVLLQALGFFLPVYFQAVLGASPFRSGVDLLPTTIAVVPFGIGAGLFMSKTGVYRPLHGAGMGLAAVGAVLLSMLAAGSSAGAWIGFQVIVAGGGGIVAATTLPAILAALPESHVATASGAYSFMRSFGYVWGVTLASIVFNGRFDGLAERITDAAVRLRLVDGAAYGFASRGFVQALPPDTQTQVVGVYVAALQTVWWVMAGVACAGFVCVLAERHIELRKELDTEFGLEEGKRRGAEGEAEAGSNATTDAAAAARGGESAPGLVEKDGQPRSATERRVDA